MDTTATPQMQSPYPLLAPEDYPNIDHIEIEDGKPIDSILAEKQSRLLTEPLYSSWSAPEGRSFRVFADVGLFFGLNLPPLVPDVMLSLDIVAGSDLSKKENLTYFVWVMGKLPEVAIEIVSNRQGGKEDHKLRAYARIGIPYYVIYDPNEMLSRDILRAFALREKHYEPIPTGWFEDVGLGLTLWNGSFEGEDIVWLRWCDRQGQVIPTGLERAVLERQRATAALDAADRLREQLRKRGIEPQA